MAAAGPFRKRPKHVRTTNLIQPAAKLPTLPLNQMALFLDVDGTLLDIAPTPDAVVVNDELKAVLAELFIRAGGAVALVSGRTVADLDRLFQPLRLPMAGQHGAEWRIAADGSTGRISTVPDRLRDLAVALAGQHPGMLVEDKGGAVALHVRARPELEGEIAQAVERIVADFPDYEVLHGKAVFEFRRKGVHKGAAVATLAEQPPFSGRTQVFIGDDTTDLDAIDTVQRSGGYGLLVGPAGPLRRPHDVRTWLAGLLHSGGPSEGESP